MIGRRKGEVFAIGKSEVAERFDNVRIEGFFFVIDARFFTAF